MCLNAGSSWNNEVGTATDFIVPGKRAIQRKQNRELEGNELLDPDTCESEITWTFHLQPGHLRIWLTCAN